MKHRSLRTRIALTVAATATAVLGTAIPASATTFSHVSGCFAWSWSDSGWFTTTVYWHNRCSTRHRIEVVWDGQAYDPTVRLVNGDGKGNAWTTSDAVTGVYDLGRA
ncbi:hypothetical protein [Streptacidiphilus neutrinimicus]|uniref:hypothetical protein n=1 Tax=Streptacidiphilus neutrinimicus TaxID=105420 RepID=UPI0005A64DED|nr:hypothetical protein [Streptacidiphilus neutrinimicus]